MTFADHFPRTTLNRLEVVEVLVDEGLVVRGPRKVFGECMFPKTAEGVAALRDRLSQEDE